MAHRERNKALPLFLRSASSKAAFEIHLPPSPLLEGRIKIHLRVCSSFFTSE